MSVQFYETAEDRLLKFAVILAKHRGKYVLCKHRLRDTLELPGGHREPGESIEETARRELAEETGAICFSIQPICAYSVIRAENFHGEETFGMLYRASIESFESELHSEIEKIILLEKPLENPPENWTYPQIQPQLFQEAARRGMA